MVLKSVGCCLLEIYYATNIEKINVYTKNNSGVIEDDTAVIFFIF